MLRWFKSLQRSAPGSGPEVAAAATAVAAPQKRQSLSGVVYPPQDPGLPLMPVKTLLGDQAELMAMLKTHAALPASQFATRFEAPITRVAEYVNCLPGSSSRAFSGAGGLFRASIEAAFAIFRAADGRIFTGDKGVEERHVLEVRWRYLCFLAGLLYPLGKPLEGLNVVDMAGRKWAAELEGLWEWAEHAGQDRVYATWTRSDAQPGPASVVGTFALKLVGRENVEWLNAGSPTLVQTLVDIVSGNAGSRDTFAAILVRDMWSAIREREESRLPQNYGQLTIGTDVSPYLLDAIVSLYKTRWKLNKETSYADRAGIYLEWPQAAHDIVEFCAKKGFGGIPSSDGALLAMLSTTRIIDGQDEGLPIVRIANADGEIVTAVRLAKPGLVMAPDETLNSIAANRPVSMAGVEAQDPLAGRPVGTVVPRAGAGRAHAPQPAPQLDVIDPAQVLGAVDGQDKADVESSDNAPGDEGGAAARSTAQPDASAARATGGPGREADSQSAQGAPAAPKQRGGPKTEGAEVRFRDLLPKEVAENLPMHDCEYLGRIVHIWRTKANGAHLMRMCEFGAAFEMALLMTVCRDPSKFLASLAERGYVYTNPSTPRKLVYKVPVSEGSQSTRESFILAAHTARKLGLQ